MNVFAIVSMATIFAAIVSGWRLQFGIAWIMIAGSLTYSPLPTHNTGKELFLSGASGLRGVATALLFITGTRIVFFIIMHIGASVIRPLLQRVLASQRASISPEMGLT